MPVRKVPYGTNRIFLLLPNTNYGGNDINSRTMEPAMSPQEYEAAVAAFIRSKGVTRCPTACAAPTHAAGSTADRAALQQRAVRLEAIREEKARQTRARMTAAA